MSLLVVDASIAGAWLLPDETSQRAELLLTRILSGAAELAVPGLWVYELTNLLVSAGRRGRIGDDQIAEAHQLLDAVPRRTFDHDTATTRDRMTHLARRFELSAYDAAYLELADRLACPLATADGRLARAASALDRSL